MIIKNFKKIFVLMFCATIFVCAGIFAFNISIEKLQSSKTLADTISTSSQTANSAVTYQDSNSLGSFIDGYVYKFTDTTKYEGFRNENQTETTDVSTVIVSSSATHGSRENPYVISTPNDWDKFVKLCGTTGGGTDKNYVLANDIDFSGIGFVPVAVFKGTFYGNGHSLKNIEIGENDWVYWNGNAYVDITAAITKNGLGLFCLCNGATITDLIVDNFQYLEMPLLRGYPDSSSGPLIGGIVGTNYNGNVTILNCSTKGEIRSSKNYNIYIYLGGILGYVYNGNATLYRCSANLTTNTKNVSNSSIGSPTYIQSVAGGVCASTGEKGVVKIYDSVGKLDLTNSAPARVTAASIFGWKYSGTSSNALLENCLGFVDATLSSGLRNVSGALTGAGSNHVTLKNCFASGKGGVEGSKQSMVTVGLMNSSISINTSTTYNVKETTNYAPQYWNAVATNSANTKTSDSDLISTAETIFSNNPVWNVEMLGSFETTNNPLMNENFQKQVIGTTFSTTYNGEKVDIENFFEGISVDTDNNCIDAGTHILTITLNNDNLFFNGLPETQRTAVVTLNIKKASLSIAQLQVDEQGKLIGLGEDQSISSFLALTVTGTIYQHDYDVHTPPEFALQYQKAGGSWTETLPTTAGTWYVRAFIKNADNCNYVLTGDGQTAFNRAKDFVAIPYFYNTDPNISVTNSTTHVSYSGSNQVFTLINDGTNNVLNGISIGENRTTGLLYSQSTGEFSVTGVGTYTVDVMLADSANTQWADGSNDSSKIITLNVLPADLNVTIDEADKTSWSKGERGFKIKVYVDGIIVGDSVKFEVTYGKVGGTEVNYVPEIDMNMSPDITGRIIISVDTTNIPIGEKYFLNVALKNDVAINKNYNLVNQMGVWEFLLTNSTIKQEDITAVWAYQNILTSGDFDNQVNGQVAYNEYEYTISLNSSLLHSGIEVSYSGKRVEKNSNNSQTYSITAILSPKDGYSFDASVTTTYTFTWTITPIACDLSSLIWAQDFDYNGETQTMRILNLPNWLTPLATYTNYMGEDAGDYTATCSVGLTQFGNHTFTKSESSQGITIASNGRSATLTHPWKINKAKIQVSNYPDLWIVKTIRNTEGDPIDLRIPTAMSAYGNQLILKYYKDSSCNEEINPVNMELNKGTGGITRPTQYFAKVTLNPSFDKNYELQNVTDSEANSATLAFNVGGIRAVIRLNVDTELVYNGQTQTVKISSNNTEYNNLVNNGSAGYIVKYYAVIDDSGNYGTEEVTPKHVGKYVAVIFVEDLKTGDEDDGVDIVNEFVVYSHAHYFEITQLKLTTNWTYTQNGISIPKENVSAQANANITDLSVFYTYKIYDSTGKNLVNQNDLTFNTRYIARLSVNDTHINESGLPNVVLLNANDDVAFTNSTEYAFTTGQNPDAPAVILDNPEIFGTTSIVYDKNSHKVEIRIRDNITNTYISNLLDYVTIELKNNSGISVIDDTDILSITNAGTYTYEIKLKEGASASWLWGGTTKEVTFTIDKKPILAPSLKTEHEWKGTAINIWTNDSIWLDWVDATGTLLATDISINSANFVLKDKNNTYWDDRTLIDSNKQSEDINITWSIVKVKVKGEWKENENGYYSFVLDNSAHNELIENKYLDENGNEVKPENFIEGKKYTAVVKVNDAEHYELIEGEKVGAELKNQFEYKKQLSLFDSISNFIKTNWLWFVIGFACLLLLIIILVIAKKKKKKVKDDEKSKLEKEKEELEKQNEKLERRLDEARYSNQMNASVSPQYVGQITPSIQVVPAMISPTSTEKDRQQDAEIQELREALAKMAKYQIASEEEKSKSEKLAKIEKMLMHFLLNEFANNPNWIPFTNQDMIDYDINDLMGLYLRAKQIKSQRLVNEANSLEQNRYREEALGFENKVAEYNKQKEDLKYEQLLKAIRDVSDAQKELEKKFDETSKKNDVESNKNSLVEKLDFDESFESLPANQKRYFNELKDFALKQPNARLKPTKQHFAIGVGNNSYIKFIIKYSTLIAVFGTTEVKLENDNSVETAKQMIEVRVKKIQEKI